MKPRILSTARLSLAIAASSLMAVTSASAQTTYTWANTNVNNTPSTLDWFTGGPNTQATWTGGTPVSSNLNTIQFFTNTATAVPNTTTVTQGSNVNNGGNAFQLGTLTFSGQAPASPNQDLTMNVAGDALNFSAATGTINLDSTDVASNGRNIFWNVSNAIQLGTASSASTLTLTGNGSSAFNFSGGFTELQTGGGSKLIKSGSSTASLSGKVTVSGGLEVNGGLLRLTNAGNAITGGITLNGGTLGDNNNTISTATLNNNLITVNGVANLGLTGGATTNGGITLNTGADLTLATNNSSATVDGAVTGVGSISINRLGLGSHTQNLNSTNNTFTGTVSFIGPATLTLNVNSLADSASLGAGNIRFVGSASTNAHTFSLGSGAIAPVTLNNRRIEIVSGSSAAYTINNDSPQALTINTDLLVGASGARSLTLGGTGAGLSTFGGKLENGSGTVSISKAGTGTWILSNTNNSYTGGTTVSAGTLKANGTNALGAGNVTVSAGTLQIDAANAMGDTASLSLPSATTKNLTMNANDTVAKLFIAGVQQPNGAYTNSGAGSAWMNTASGILTVGAAASQPVYWDLDGSTAGAGGATPAGTWDAANAYWNNATGTGTAAAWTAGATAAFAAGSDATGTYSVTVDGTPDIGGLTFEEGTVTLSGGTALRLVSDSLASVNTGLTATIATPLSQDATARGLTKIGTGTLVLASGTNSYTGPTSIGAGTLQLTNTSAISSSSGLSLATGATLALRSDTAATFSTPANGVGLNTLVEGATASMDANNNGLGANQTLALGGGIRMTTTQSLTTKLNVTGGNGYALSVPNLTIANPVSGSPTVNFNPTTASVVIDALSASPRSGSTIVLALDGTSTGNVVNHSASSSTAWMQVTKAGTGTWTWNLNTETSGKLGNASDGLSAGTLVVNGSLSFQGSGRFFTMSGGTLCLNSTNAIGNGAFNALTITGGNLDNTSGSPVTLTTNPLMSWSGNFAFLGSNGANSDLNLGTGAMAMNAARTVTVSNAATTLTVGGVISGNTFGLTKAGDGMLKLAGASTYNGATTVSAGTLSVTGSLGATAVTVNAGTLAGNGNIGGNVTIASGARHALAVAATPGAQDTSLITGTLAMADSILDLTAATTPAAGEYVLATATVGITGTPTTINYNGISGTVSVDNASTPKRLLLTVSAGSAYDTWATAKGLDGTPGKENGKADDPDKDGRNNLYEFAVDGDPLSGANDGKIVGKIATVGSDQKMTLTLPVRTGATFSADSGDLLSALIDGIYYRIEGSVDLGTFNKNIAEVSPAITDGLPSPLTTGWTYRTFTFAAPDTVPTVPKAFLRARISETP